MTARLISGGRSHSCEGDGVVGAGDGRDEGLQDAALKSAEDSRGQLAGRIVDGHDDGPVPGDPVAAPPR